jgi:hypothetical protein
MGVGGVCASHTEGSLGTERTVNSLSLLLGRVRQNGRQGRAARRGEANPGRRGPFCENRERGKGVQAGRVDF